MQSRVWVVGSSILDFVFRTERFPRPGESLLGGPFATYAGGKGANQAHAIARLSGNASFVGMVGNDPSGEVIRSSLQHAGVDTTHLYSHPTTHTGVAAVLVDPHGMNEIVVVPGANMELTPSHVDGALSAVESAPILVQLEIPMESVRASIRGPLVFLNPAPAVPVSDDLLSRCFVATPNESEAEGLTGIRPSDESSCRRAATALLDKGVRNAVLTLGERGCFWMSAEEEVFIPAPSVDAVDTVGAGDAFNGALAYFYSQGRDLRNALELATHAAAISVTRHGAQASMPTLQEVKEFVGGLW